jgi:hypothetical protein
MFRTVDGDLIKCTQTIAILPGKIRPDTEVADSQTDRPYKVLGSSSAVIRRAGYHSGMAIAGDSQELSQVGFKQKSPNSSGIKTSTISMTPSMSQRLALANQNHVKKSRAADSFVSQVLDNKKILGPETGGIVTTTLPNLPSSDIELQQGQKAPTVSGRAFGMPGAF